MGGNRDSWHMSGSQPPLQFITEHQVRKLGLGIGRPAVVAPLPLEVIEMYCTAELVSITADDNNPRAIDGNEIIEQKPGESEMTEIVRAELQFEAVRCHLLRRNHYASIIYQQVNPWIFGTQGLSSGVHRSQRSQVERLNSNFGTRRCSQYSGLGSVALLRVANCEHHRGSALR
jgi:hypothetical protein